MSNFAHLKDDSPFRPLFENGMVPIKNILLPKRAVMIGDNGDEPQEFYDVDVAKLSPEQVDAIAVMVARQRGGSPVQVKDYMRTHGIPLRSIHVACTSSTDVLRHLL